MSCDLGRRPLRGVDATCADQRCRRRKCRSGTTRTRDARPHTLWRMLMRRDFAWARQRGPGPAATRGERPRRVCRRVVESRQGKRDDASLFLWVRPFARRAKPERRNAIAPSTLRGELLLFLMGELLLLRQSGWRRLCSDAARCSARDCRPDSGASTHARAELRAQ